MKPSDAEAERPQSANSPPPLPPPTAATRDLPKLVPDSPALPDAPVRPDPGVQADPPGRAAAPVTPTTPGPVVEVTPDARVDVDAEADADTAAGANAATDAFPPLEHTTLTLDPIEEPELAVASAPPATPPTFTPTLTPTITPDDTLTMTSTDVPPTVPPTTPMPEPADVAPTEPAQPAVATRTRASRKRVPLARPFDIYWFLVMVAATALGLAFLTIAASRWPAGDQVGAGEAIFTGIGLVLLAVVVAVAGFSPLSAIVIGLLVAGIGSWWLIDPSGAGSLLGWLTDRPLFAGLSTLLASGIVPIFGLATLVLGVATAGARIVGRRVGAERSALHWVTALIALVVVSGACVVLVLGDRQTASPAWLIVAGVLAAGVGFVLAKISPLPVAIGGALLPLAAGGVLLAAASGWLHLSASAVAWFGPHLPMAAAQVLSVGALTLAATIAGRLGRLPTGGARRGGPGAPPS